MEDGEQRSGEPAKEESFGIPYHFGAVLATQQKSVKESQKLNTLTAYYR